MMTLSKSALIVTVTSAAMLTVFDEVAAEKRKFRKPVPPGVVEKEGIIPSGSIVERKDGSLMLGHGTDYQLSTDGGLTWGRGQPLHPKINVVSMLRLNLGRLGVFGENGGENWLFSTSPDDGATWSELTEICPRIFSPLYNSMIQLTTGRLLIALQQGWAGAHPDL